MASRSSRNLAGGEFIRAFDRHHCVSQAAGEKSWLIAKFPHVWQWNFFRADMVIQLYQFSSNFLAYAAEMSDNAPVTRG
jgi:hypothetical protein